MATRFGWDDFVLDLDAYRLERGGIRLSLEPKALNLLALMVRRPGHLFSKQEIFDAVWPDTAVTDHALTRVVAQLRRTLGDEAREARYLETVPTRGYRWIKEVEALADRAVPAPPASQVSPIDSPRRPLVPGLAAAFVLMLAVLVFLGWASAFARRESGELRRDAKAPLQITTHHGLDMQPALSPQGDAIAFVSDRSGALEIYTRSLGGGATEAPLTSDGGHNVQPDWSPDARLIAYHSYRHGGVWIVPARGGTPRQIAPVGSKPAWSPDGRTIAFQSDEHADAAPTGFSAQAGSRIWLIDAAGGNPRPLTAADRPIGGHAAPAWSPDGRRLVFSVFDGPGRGIWAIAVDGGDAQPLDLGAGRFESVFAPDGSAVFVATGEAFIVRLPVDAASGTLTGPREIVPVPGVPGVRALSLSPDGKRLAFAGLSLDSQIWSQPIAPDGNASGSPRPLTRDTNRRNTFPAVSRDGSRIAYVSTRSGELSDVSVMNIDGSNVIQATPAETSDHKPAWFPDGKRLAYWSADGESLGLRAIDVATRRTELVFDFSSSRTATQVPGKVAEFQLSPSMKHVAFSMITPTGRRALYVTPFGSLLPRRLTGDAESVGYPAWSPDERSIAVEMKRSAEDSNEGPAEGSTYAGVIDVSTGALRQLTHTRGQAWVRSWSPDGTRLALAVLRDGVWGLRWIDVRSGAEGIMLAPLPPGVYVRYPEWSPRGDVVVFERGEMRGNIWTIDVK